MAYEEFQVRVPIWDLSTAEGDSEETGSLFEILNVTRMKTSLRAKYDSYYDDTVAGPWGRTRGPWGRVGRGDLRMFLSNTDDDTFIAVDMFDEATDQMNTVSLEVRAQACSALQVCALMQSIRAGAEVASDLLQGNLGIKETLAFGNFPRHVKNHMSTALQHIQVYKNGKLLCSSNSP
jgi:hypothetical protein